LLSMSRGHRLAGGASAAWPGSPWPACRQGSLPLCGTRRTRCPHGQLQGRRHDLRGSWRWLLTVTRRRLPRRTTLSWLLGLSCFRASSTVGRCVGEKAAVAMGTGTLHHVEAAWHSLAVLGQVRVVERLVPTILFVHHTNLVNVRATRQAARTSRPHVRADLQPSDALGRGRQHRLGIQDRHVPGSQVASSQAGRIRRDSEARCYVSALEGLQAVGKRGLHLRPSEVRVIAGAAVDANDPGRRAH